jgi:methyltransferase (TIGR00027 family)
LTAFYVAFSRAAATSDRSLSRACQDELAAQLLPAPLGKLVEHARAHPGLARLLRASAMGMGEHMALRTRVIDDALDEAVRRGVRQLVLLGAGLDARAHRLPQLAELSVFEVDHPSTQAFKRHKARALPVCARTLQYVACNFEQESFGAALARSTFDASAPTAWIWEGVTMYLPMDAIESSLQTNRALSPPGSRLIASYLVPAPKHLRGLQALGLMALAAIAEPVHSHFTPEAMAALLGRHGFHAGSDVAPRALAGRYDIVFPRLSFGAPGERIVVAERADEHLHAALRV